MIYVYFLAAFTITVLIECSITYLIYRSKNFMYYIFLCNLLTNPALNLITILVQHIFGNLWYSVSLVIGETAVILIEGKTIKALCDFTAGKALKLSLILNTSSFAAGLILLLIAKIFIKK